MNFNFKKVLPVILILFTHFVHSQNVVICTGQYAYSWHVKSDCPGLSNCKGSVTSVTASYAKNTLNRLGCCICTSEANCKTDRNSYVGTNGIAVPQSWESNSYNLMGIGSTLQARYYHNLNMIQDEIYLTELIFSWTKQKTDLTLADKDLLERIYKNFITYKERLGSYDYSQQSNFAFTYDWVHNHYLLMKRIFDGEGYSISSQDLKNTLRDLPSYNTARNFDNQERVQASKFPIIQYYYFGKNLSYYNGVNASGSSLGLDLEWSENKYFVSMSVDMLTDRTDENEYRESYNIGLKQLFKGNVMIGLHYSYGSNYPSFNYSDTKAVTFSIQKNIALSKIWYVMPKVTYSTNNLLILDLAISRRFNNAHNFFFYW